MMFDMNDLIDLRLLLISFIYAIPLAYITVKYFL